MSNNLTCNPLPHLSHLTLTNHFERKIVHTLSWYLTLIEVRTYLDLEDLQTIPPVN